MVYASNPFYLGDTKCTLAIIISLSHPIDLLERLTELGFTRIYRVTIFDLRD